MIEVCNSCGKKVLLLLFSLLIILITTLLSTSLTNQHQTITIVQTNDDNNTFRIYENPTYGIQGHSLLLERACIQIGICHIHNQKDG